MTDERKMGEIRVTWQLGLFVAAVFALPIALVPVLMVAAGDDSVSGPVLAGSGGAAAGLLLAMGVAVRSRVRQARAERLPDGRPMDRWVLRQTAIGTGLCAAGAVVLAGLLFAGAPQALALAGCTMAAGPGVLLIGRALAPAT